MATKLLASEKCWECVGDTRDTRSMNQSSAMLAFRWVHVEIFDHTIAATCCCSGRLWHFSAAAATHLWLTHEANTNECSFYLQQCSNKHKQFTRILSPHLWTKTRQLNKIQVFLCEPTAPHNPSIKVYIQFFVPPLRRWRFFFFFFK